MNEIILNEAETKEALYGLQIPYITYRKWDKERPYQFSDNEGKRYILNKKAINKWFDRKTINKLKRKIMVVLIWNNEKRTFEWI